MASHRPSNGYPYPYGGYDHSERPDLRHHGSSISAVSSLDSWNRGSTVYHPSPTDTPDLYRWQSADEEDISRVQIPSTKAGLISPVSADSSRSHSRLSQLLPETLRVGSSSPFRGSQSYEPVSSGPSKPPSARQEFRRFSNVRTGSISSLLSMRHGTLHEDEEIDMGLIGSAGAMGLSKQKTACSTLEEEDEGNMPILSPMGIGFDVSSFTEPAQNEQQQKEINRQEAAGILTGGLGAGWKPDSTITSKDLYANAPQTPHTPGLGRAMTFGKRATSFRAEGSLARKATVRQLGQIEANKRGEIIEIVIEPAVDISSFAGTNNTNVNFDTIDGPRGGRKNTLIVPTTEIFYPQANWKPFSMRWPYLTALIMISVVLAAAQEYILHKGALYTFTKASNLSTWDYFTFKYLPTLVAVTNGILWQVTDNEVKRLEAYYQLSKDGGALAAESINVDYITFFNFLRPLKALRFKHYAVAVSSAATLMAVSLVPTLQAASVVLKREGLPNSDPANVTKEIHINPLYSRCLSAILLMNAFLGCVLVWQLERRPSGLVADVKGIAGIAAMANRSHILMDFKDMDTATPEMIHQTLKSHRYSLRNSSLAPEENLSLTQKERDKYDGETLDQNPHPLMLRIVAGIPFVVWMVVVQTFVPVLLFQKDVNILTDKVPWLPTILSVSIKLLWGTLETDVRMIEPFYILSKRHASPKVMTLDYSGMAFGWMPVRAFYNGHFLVGLVGLGSVFAEVLTVCSTSFANVSGTEFAKGPSSGDGMSERKLRLWRRSNKDYGVNGGEETFLSFWLSFGLAMAIITYLYVVAVLVYWRRRHPFLPRQPNTIASILAFIHQSKMLYDFVGTEKMNNDEMVARLAKVGKKYGLGWFVGRDGDIHCGVDEEELVSNYKHGHDATKASQPWSTNWENY